MEFNEIKQLEKNFRDLNYSNFINTKIQSADILYMNPLGIFDDNPKESPDKKVDIKSRLIDEIENDACRSFVVLGNSGSGKTSLALHLCNEFWKKVSIKLVENITNNLFIPIYISLRQVELQKDCKNILSTFCENSPGKIKLADLNNWNLLLFLDGYDELEEKINLWDHNNWWLPDRSKKIKTVTFCKTIALKVSEREQCFRFGYNEKSKFINVQSFEADQIDDYIRKTTNFLRSISIDDEEIKNDPWMMTKKITELHVAWETDTQEYQKWFTNIFPDLKKLAGNPYLLTIILQILPGIVEDCKKSEDSFSVSEQERSIRIRCSTEVGIYDEFVDQWFKYQATKIRKNKSNPDFMDIPVDHLSGFMKAYSQNLAFTLIQKNGGFLGDGSVSEKNSNLYHLWKPLHNKELLDLVETDARYSKLFLKDEDDDDYNRKHNFLSLRNAGFLSNPTIGTFKFFHSSLVEYLASREVFENTRGRFNFYLTSDDPKYDKEFGINTTDLTNPSHHTLLKNLAQRAQTNDLFKNLLFEIIALSTEIFIISQMSANAITILNFAGISLSGRDFRNVQIAKANLSGANTANSDFQFANLAGANLQQSWMVGCKFQGANLDKVDFGQNCSVCLGSDYVVGIVQYMKGGVTNLVISCDNAKVHNYNSEFISKINMQTFTQKHVLFVFEHLLLNQQISDNETRTDSALYPFFRTETCLNVSVWNLHLNQQMEPILVKNPRPVLSHTKYWISKELLDTTDEINVDMICVPNEKGPYSSLAESSANDGLKNDLSEAEIYSTEINPKEKFYYYEIQCCSTGEVGVVLLWGYVIKENAISEYREPQIIDTYPIGTNEQDKTVFRFYSDFVILGCGIYQNKLVAIQGKHFMMIFATFPACSLLSKHNFLTDDAEFNFNDIKFSPNGKYLICKGDFVFLHIFNKERVDSIVKLMKVEAENITNFFVVFDKSSEMCAFSYDDTIFICKLPCGSIIQKMYTKDGLVFSLFPTFAFIDETSTNGGNNRLFSYVTANSNQTSLETILLTKTTEPISHKKVKELGELCISNDNHRVAAFYEISNIEDATKSIFLSVYTTPISSQSRLFHTHIDSAIYKVLFTPNYLLIQVKSKVLVLDMNGNFFPSINFPLELHISTFISSKYQKIVLCSNLGNKALQLRTIAERVIDNSHESPVVFENPNNNLCIVDMHVGRLTFDSKNGTHILLEDMMNQNNLWLWVPSQNWYTKISQDGVSITRSLSGINAFYVVHDGKLCVSNSFGFYFLKMSSDNSVKAKKSKFCLYHHGYKNIKSRFYLNVGWYIYGNSDGQLNIYNLKSNDSLTQFLFPHPVNDFNLHFKYNTSGHMLETVDILSWDWDDNISSLVIEDINLMSTDIATPDSFLKWRLNWTVKTNSVLNFQNSIIAKTFNLNESNKRLLNNLKVNLRVGDPWPEKRKYFSLSELYMPITETDTKFAIINTKGSDMPRMPILSNMWVVSAIAKNSNSDRSETNTAHIEHVGLLIEGINNGRHFAMKAELSTDNKTDYVKIRLVPVSTRERLDELKNDYIARQWLRPKSDIQRLIRSIQNDQIVSRKYNLLRNNCATWCIEKLKQIDIKKDRKKWYRRIFLADLPSDLFSVKDRIVKNRLPFNPSKST